MLRFYSIVQQIYENYRNSFELEVLSGGMIVDDQIKTMGGEEKSESLRKSYQRIEEQTGVTF